MNILIRIKHYALLIQISLIQFVVCKRGFGEPWSSFEKYKGLSRNYKGHAHLRAKVYSHILQHKALKCKTLGLKCYYGDGTLCTLGWIMCCY